MDPLAKETSRHWDNGFVFSLIPYSTQTFHPEESQRLLGHSPRRPSERQYQKFPFRTPFTLRRRVPEIGVTPPLANLVTHLGDDRLVVVAF